MQFIETPGRFVPGKLLATQAAVEAVPSHEMKFALCRHFCCDWGEVSEQASQANKRALRLGERLMSVYRTEDDTKFWIITEADRSCSTVLLPCDY